MPCLASSKKKNMSRLLLRTYLVEAHRLAGKVAYLPLTDRHELRHKSEDPSSYLLRGPENYPVRNTKRGECARALPLQGAVVQKFLRFRRTTALQRC